jgi:uncharacterized protein (DUF983 family)
MAKRYKKEGYKCDKCNENYEIQDADPAQITVVIPGELSQVYELCPTCTALFIQKRNEHDNFSMKY